MRRFLSWTSAAVLLLLSGTPSEAGVTYNVSGTFGTDLGAASDLTGGSFAVTYQASGFPLSPGESANLYSFSVSVFDSSGTLINAFNSPDGSGGVIANSSNSPGLPPVFALLSDPDGSGYIILDFGDGFTGTGPVIPTDIGQYHNYASGYISTNYDNYATIQSGYSSVAVPEPPSFALAGMAALAGLLAGMRRRKLCSSISTKGILAVLFLALGIARVEASNVLVNGGFENEPNFGSGVINNSGWSALTGSQIPGWTIEAGHAVTVHNNTFPTISGTYSVNTDGEGYNGHNADLYQDFASTIGVSNTLSFDWEGWLDGTNAKLEISVTDTVTSSVLFNGLYSWDGGLHLHHVTTTFLGTGDTLQLRIQESPESGFNDNTYIVDNFSVTTAVPEPSTLLMSGTMTMIAIGYWCSRRTPKSASKS